MAALHLLRVGGSTGSIRASENAEKTNVAASATSATGAESSATSRPAALGPATNVRARLPLISDVPSTYRSRGTSETKSVL